MEKLKKWISEHKNETIGFGVFLALFIVLTGGVAYYSFAEPPKDTKAATGQETSVAVKGQNEKVENEEQDKDKKETDTNEDNEKASETAKKDTAAKEKEEKYNDRKSEEEKKNEQEKKQENSQKSENTKVTETAAAASSSEETSAKTEQTADSGASAPAAPTQQESGNTQATQPDPEPVQETPVQEVPTQEIPVQETPVQPEQEQPATPEPEPEPQPVWHEPVYEQQKVVDQAAWDETVSEPIYENIELCICNGCGADITSDPWGHLESQMLAGNMACSGYHSEWQQVQTGTNTYTVHHDEIWHYENVLVQEGYWE